MFGVNGIDFSQIQVGNTPITEVYVGNLLVWQLVKPYILTVENNTNRIIHVIVNGTQIGNATANKTSEFSINEGSSVYLQYSTAGELPYYNYYFDNILTNSSSFKMLSDKTVVASYDDHILTDITMLSSLTLQFPGSEFYVQLTGRNLNDTTVRNYVISKLTYDLNGLSELQQDGIHISSPMISDSDTESMTLQYGITILDDQYHSFKISYSDYLSATLTAHREINPINYISINNILWGTDLDNDGKPEGHSPDENNYYSLDGWFSYTDNSSPSLDSLKLLNVSNDSYISVTGDMDSSGMLYKFIIKLTSEDFLHFGPICTVTTQYEQVDPIEIVMIEEEPQVTYGSITIQSSYNGFYNTNMLTKNSTATLEIQTGEDIYTSTVNFGESKPLLLGSKVRVISVENIDSLYYVSPGALPTDQITIDGYNSIDIPFDK